MKQDVTVMSPEVFQQQVEAAGGQAAQTLFTRWGGHLVVPWAALAWVAAVVAHRRHRRLLAALAGLFTFLALGVDALLLAGRCQDIVAAARGASG